MEERQVTGICKFCGQVTALGNVAALRERELADPDYWATRGCTCREAQEFSRAELRKEDERQLRENALSAARDLIMEKLGLRGEGAERARPYYTALDEKVMDVCTDLTPLIYDGIMDSVKFGAVDGSTVEMWMDEKTRAIAVTRTKKLKW